MRKKVVASALLVASAISAPLIYWFHIRVLFYILAAYHLVDVPPSWLGWFTSFSWAVRSIPFVWLACFILTVIEFTRRKRTLLLATYVAAPFAPAAICWVAWQIFVQILVRRQMHSDF